MGIELILASEKRRLVEIEEEKRAIEREEQKKKEKEYTEMLIHKWTDSILYSLKEKIENKNTIYDFNYFLDYDNYFVPEFFESQKEATNNILNKCLRIIVEVLEIGGYSAYIHEYAKNYQTRSNQFGYIHIGWND